MGLLDGGGADSGGLLSSLASLLGVNPAYGAMAGNAARGALAGLNPAPGGFWNQFGYGARAGAGATYEHQQQALRQKLGYQQIQAGQIDNAAKRDEINRRRGFLGQQPLSQDDFASGNWDQAQPGPGPGSMGAPGAPGAPGVPGQTSAAPPSASGAVAMPQMNTPAVGDPAWKTYLSLAARATQYGLPTEAASYRQMAEADPQYKIDLARGMVPVDVEKQTALTPGEVTKAGMISDVELPNRMAVARAGRNSFMLNMPPAETRFQWNLGEENGKQAAGIIQGQDAAVKTIDQIRTYRGLLEQYKAAGGEPGKLAPLKNDVTAFLQSVHLDPDKFGLESNAGYGQALQAASNALMMGKLGPGGFPSQNFSDTDRTFLEKTVPRLNQTEKGQLMIADIAQRTAERSLKGAQAWAQYPQTEAGFQAFKKDWSKFVAETPLFSPAEVSAASAEASAARAPTASTPASGGRPPPPAGFVPIQ